SVLGGIGAVRAGADNTGDLVFRPSIAGTQNERVRVTSDGRLGIGTNAPMAALDVYGGAGTFTTSSTINALGAAGTGNITVASTAGFPATGTLQAELEAMSYSVVNATTLNISARARYGTTGAAHPNGAGVVYMESLLSKGPTTTPHQITNSLGWLGLNTGTPAAPLDVRAGTLGDGSLGFHVNGTLPTVMTSDTTGALFNFTSAGSSPQNQTGLGVILAGGYTGSFDTVGATFQNFAASTSNNFGAVGAVAATGGGQNIGVAGYASLGVRNIGGYFAAEIHDLALAQSAALMANNVTTTGPIFVGMDNSTEVFRIHDGGNVGIMDPSPDTTLKVVGSICAKSDGNNCAGAVAGTVYANNTTVQSADYAEYFHAEEKLAPGEIVGLSPASGLARAYRRGDRLLGVVSTSPGVVGNSEIQDERSVLVALMGQVPFRRDRVRIEDGQVLTPDGKPLGYLLSDGRVYVNVGSTGQDRAIASLKAENARLALENAEIKARLERIEKALLSR
ncbi:MAG TPA: peptidase G2 autoproteolytic cleavage domain-containing protein, partial [Bdellovibrionota bacterium]|nr:peptidase G2 autoproteolytic cleavage domain-containing protein [Bdellovibrionota bacterium]